jgi:zinc D-Ala-D-Ala carboxypeptidase
MRHPKRLSFLSDFGRTVWSATIALVASHPVLADTSAEKCDVGDYAAARQNTVSLTQLSWNFYGRPETGWDAVATHIAHDLETACPVTSPAFATALQAWQRRNGIAASGRMSRETLHLFVEKWQHKRLLRHGFGKPYRGCKYGPQEALVMIEPSHDRTSRQIMLVNKIDPKAYAAYRKMFSVARTELGVSDGDMLRIFSAHRPPDYNQKLCDMDGRCDGVQRAICSLHFTGRALDLVVGGKNGDTSHENRTLQSQGIAYGWLLKNAGKYGFVNYAFEPWHWEYVGDLR